MKHYVGLDVSVKETVICVVDEDGQICREMKVTSHPADLAFAVSNIGVRVERIGLEAGPLSQWLFEGLALWRYDYNNVRPHSSLGNQAPAEARRTL